MSTTTIADPLPKGIQYKEDCQFDIYFGTDEALIAAGLIEQRHLPGQPGCGKTMTSWSSDGSRVRQGDNGPCREPGYMSVARQGKYKLTVRITPSEGEQRRREEIRKAQWDAEQALRQYEIASRRAERVRKFGRLRLVWSAR